MLPMLKNGRMLHFYKVSVDIFEEVWWVHPAMSLSTKSCTLAKHLWNSDKNRSALWIIIFFNLMKVLTKLSVPHLSFFWNSSWLVNLANLPSLPNILPIIAKMKKGKMFGFQMVTHLSIILSADCLTYSNPAIHSHCPH